MRVARSQTKRAISNAKHAIGLKLGGRLALGYRTYQIYIKLDFHKKSHKAGFLIDSHISLGYFPHTISVLRG